MVGVPLDGQAGGGCDAAPPVRRACSRRTRRDVLRWLGGAAGAAAGLELLPGCSASAVRPAPANPVTTVHVQLNVQIPSSAIVQRIVQQMLDEGFNAAHRGVRAIWEPWGNMPAVIAAIVAGNGPLVIAGSLVQFATVLPFLAALDVPLRQDGDPPSLWSSNQLDSFRRSSGLYAVPGYTACEPFIYRQDILDDLGQPYPAPDWTYLDAQRLWQACSGESNGAHRYGVTLPFGPGNLDPGAFFIFPGFGGAYADSGRLQCLLDEPSSVQAGEYFFPMVWSGVAASGDGTPSQGMVDGSVVFSQGAGHAVLWAVQNLGQRVRWDFIPYPRWPVRPATVANGNFYGLNALAGQTELAWELFRFAAIEPGFVRQLMRLTLQEPALLSLWDEWMAVVTAQAPLLRGKALHFWRDAAVQGEGYGPVFFERQPVQAEAIVTDFWTKIWQRALGVREGFTMAAERVNALESAAATEGAPPSGRELVAQQQRALRRLNTMFGAATD